MTDGPTRDELIAEIAALKREAREREATVGAVRRSMRGDAFIGRRSIIRRTPGCEDVEVAYRTVFEGGVATVVEYSMNTPAGPRTFQSHMVPDFDADGAVAGVISVARDVTALREAEEA